MPKVKIPEDFICPITLELIKDPVIAADGYTYERIAIEKWLFKEMKDISPRTDLKLKHKELITNRFAKNQILMFLEKNPLCNLALLQKYIF